MWPLRRPQRPADGLATLAWATTPQGGLNASKRRFWLRVWGTIFGCLGVLDIYRMTKHDGSTLSASIRYVFSTDTPEGKVLFLGALAVLAYHIFH